MFWPANADPYRDNSTRGLDASTALDYAKSLRVMTDVSNRTTLVTLYQAGEEIYKLMDKVLVIDEGRMMFQGPASDAKQYFIDLGFECPERETTADFLTSVTDPTQRVFRKGFEAQAPKTAGEFERAFKNSSNYQKVLQDVQDYERHLESTDFVDAREFEQSVKEQKSRHVSEKSNFTVSFWSQVMVSEQAFYTTEIVLSLSQGVYATRNLACMGRQGIYLHQIIHHPCQWIHCGIIM